MRRRFRSSGFGLDEVFVGFIEFIEFIELWFGRVPGCECLGALFLCGGGGRTVWWTGCLGTGLWTGGLYVRVWCGRFAGSYYVSVASAVQGTP